MRIGMVSILCTLQVSMAFGAQSLSLESRVAENAPLFATADEAAVAALRVSKSKSTRYEFGGCIFTDGQVFYFTDPVSNGREDQFKAICLATGQFVAIYHTHPVGSLVGISSIDINLAKRLNKTSYVGMLDQNRVVKFTPGKTRTECYSGSSCRPSARVSQGDFVGSL